MVPHLLSRLSQLEAELFRTAWTLRERAAASVEAEHRVAAERMVLQSRWRFVRDELLPDAVEELRLRPDSVALHAIEEYINSDLLAPHRNLLAAADRLEGGDVANKLRRSMMDRRTDVHYIDDDLLERLKWATAAMVQASEGIGYYGNSRTRSMSFRQTGSKTAIVAAEQSSTR
jgi:hypothetical protein